MNKYDNIIYLDHPTSKKHPRMSSYNRAAQFSPFAALAGYEGIIIESGRTTAEKLDIDEYQIEQINSSLQYLIDKPNVTISITYFVKDNLKDGGSYFKEETSIKKIDIDNHLLITTSGSTINIDDIYSLNII